MKIIVSVSISIFLFLGSLSALHAETHLSGNDIQHFMNAMKPLQKLGDKYDFEENNNKSAEDQAPMVAPDDFTNFTPMSQSLTEITGHKAYGEFEAIVHNAGFSSPQQWATVGDRVMKAYMSLKMIAELTPEKLQEMQVSIEEVKKNEYLSPEMKTQILGSLNQMIAMTTNLSEHDKADQKTLKPYLTKLERLFEE
ncbi:MAG: hypothetical protein JKY45_13670 [Emcibacter sp.]|nr:hypothetical protein [Emcibacter sp.]